MFEQIGGDSAVRFVRRPEVLTRRVLEGLLLLSDDADEPILVSPPGDLVWDLLARPSSLEFLTGQVAERYAVGAEEVTRDLQALLEALLESNTLDTQSGGLTTEGV